MMSRNRITAGFWKWGLTILFVAGMIGPLILLFAKAFLFLFENGMKSTSFISGSLFLESIGINFTAAFLCSLSGAFIALFIWSKFKHHYKEIFLAVLLCAVIPPFIHVHAWIQVMDLFNSTLNTRFGFSFNFTGAGAVVWTSAFSYIPFTTSFCLMGLSGIPVEIIDLMRSEVRPWKVFLKGVIPGIASYFFVGGVIVFLITMNDYAIPSAFGVNVFALELFSLFSASGNLYAIALSSVPLIGLSLLLLFLFGWGMRRVDATEDPVLNYNPFQNEGFMRIISRIGGVLSIMFILVPIAAMVVNGVYAKNLPSIILDSRREIAYSFWVSACVSVCSIFPAALFVYSRNNIKRKAPMLFLLAIPFLVPSAILGLGLIEFWNRDGLSFFYQSPVMPVIGLTVRFCILAILFLTVRMSRIESGLMDAMRLSYSFAGGFFKVLLPMIWKDMLACFLLIFALAMGEYGIVLLVTPPGYQMLTIKIYNYLHYGASDVVFALNLFVLILVVLVGTVVFKLYTAKKE